MIRAIVASLLALGFTVPAEAASVSKTYSYFSVGGTTLEQLEAELSLRGPQVSSTGRRHPGATQMQFNTRIGYAEKDGYCRVSQATVNVSAKVILPRWSQRRKADGAVRTIWDTLSADIKRHEESHVGIAKNHARELEQALMKLDRRKTCAEVAEKAKAVSERILAKHDKAQYEFDRIEGINFERRMMRQLGYRLERMQSSR